MLLGIAVPPILWMVFIALTYGRMCEANPVLAADEAFRARWWRMLPIGVLAWALICILVGWRTKLLKNRRRKCRAGS